MTSRRQVLAAIAGVAASSGCLARAPVVGVDAAGIAPPELDPGDRVRARASEVAIEETLSLGEHETYVGTNGTIKYPMTTSGDEDFTYDFVAVETYLRLESGTLASAAVDDVLDSAFGDLELVSAFLTSYDGNSPVIEVRHRTYVEDGEVAESPPVSAAALVAEMPRAVDVTVHLHDTTVEMRYPVFVRKLTATYNLGPEDDDA